MRIYADHNYLPRGVGHVMMLFPFWGKGHPENGRFERYSEIGRSLFEMTSLEEADFAVMPAPWELVADNKPALDLACEFARNVNACGKRTIIFFWSDSDEEVPIDNAVVFRTSMYRSKRRTNEYAMPSWSDDFVMKYQGGKLPVREKKRKPVVGFCGYAAPLEPPLSSKLRAALGAGAALWRKRKRQPRHGAYIRAEALRYLSQSNQVETNFIIRDQFLAGALLAGGRTDSDCFSRAQLEYVHNMIESDYILCARGGGNFSYRLYETLSCGRIPVFVDTDCVLPYDFAVDWNRHCVWVDASELSKISGKVAEFHNSLSPQEFADLQRENRLLWEDWLSPEGFFANLHKHFPSGRP